MKAVLISIQPKWCELIANGEKTLEVRKTAPAIKRPFKVYIYCTKIKDNKKYTDEFDIPLTTRKWCGNGKVIGEFVCKGMMCNDAIYMKHALSQHCLTIEELQKYCKGKNLLGWRIADLKIYDKPKELSELYTIPKQNPNVSLRDTCNKDKNTCEDCQGIRKYLSRPPQSWMYVEEEV